MDAQAEADAALRRLAAVGLIEPLSDGALRLHHLLAAYARARAADSTGDCAFVEQALVAESADLHAGGSPQVWQPCLDHLRFAVTRAEPRDDTTATLLTGLAVLLKTQRAYAEARSLLERALAIRERVLGPEHSDTATGLNNIAVLLNTQGAYQGFAPQTTVDIRNEIAVRDMALECHAARNESHF